MIYWSLVVINAEIMPGFTAQMVYFFTARTLEVNVIKDPGIPVFRAGCTLKGIFATRHRPFFSLF